MLRVGLIGLGDIARKAYLPAIGVRGDTQLILCTRSEQTLTDLSARYRPASVVRTMEELIVQGIDAAFVHAATEAHPKIIRKLLEHGIHVYVDKPIAYTFEVSQELTELARSKGLILFTGFNRRFAPMVAELAMKEQKRIVHMQKNRVNQPDYARRFIFDDFIHVVDTLRYLAPGVITDTQISLYQQDGKLVHVQLQLSGEGFVSTGIMNRDSGAGEEKLEVMAPGIKWTVTGLNETMVLRDKMETKVTFGDWDSVLHRRGFEQIIDHFLSCVRDGIRPLIGQEDALETHQICEEIVRRAEGQGALPWRVTADHH